ncbi:hypothetical protein [Amycolatopsis sp. NPDC051372]|uniref:hypothetical protein n=1 Tax=Amycolatopsis sp. NPDC051372 TaxID=3155669 RepID=UPI00342209BB
MDALLAPLASAAPSTTPAVNTRLAPIPDHPADAAFRRHDPHYVAAARTSCCSGHQVAARRAPRSRARRALPP